MKKIILTLSLLLSASILADSHLERNIASAEDVQENEVALVVLQGNIYCVDHRKKNTIPAGIKGVLLTGSSSLNCDNFRKQDQTLPKPR